MFYKRKPITATNPRVESPQDFILKFLTFIKHEPEHKNLTPKGYALLMKARREAGRDNPKRKI
jgi:hypothetical protein